MQFKNSISGLCMIRIPEFSKSRMQIRIKREGGSVGLAVNSDEGQETWAEEGCGHDCRPTNPGRHGASLQHCEGSRRSEQWAVVQNGRKCTGDEENGSYELVFQIHDILGWIRIRGSMPLTNGPDLDPDPAIYIINLQDACKKLFFSAYTFWNYNYIIFQDEKSKRVTK